MTEKRNEPNGFFGHWAKHLIENEGVEEVDDTENIEEEYDLGVYGDDDAEQQTDWCETKAQKTQKPNKK